MRKIIRARLFASFYKVQGFTRGHALHRLRCNARTSPTHLPECHRTVHLSPFRWVFSRHLFVQHHVFLSLLRFCNQEAAEGLRTATCFLRIRRDCPRTRPIHSHQGDVAIGVSEVNHVPAVKKLPSRAPSTRAVAREGAVCKGCVLGVLKKRPHLT